MAYLVGQRAGARRRTGSHGTEVNVLDNDTILFRKELRGAGAEGVPCRTIRRSRYPYLHVSIPWPADQRFHLFGSFVGER